MIENPPWFWTLSYLKYQNKSQSWDMVENLFSFPMSATMLHLKNKSHKLREAIFFLKNLNEPIMLVLIMYNMHFQAYFCHNNDTLEEWIAPRVDCIIFYFLLKRILMVSFCLLIWCFVSWIVFTVAQMLQNIQKRNPVSGISAP